MSDNRHHDMLTAVGRVLSLYGASGISKLVHDSNAATNRQWTVMFKDAGDPDGQWYSEFEGTFIECLDMIREYNKPADKPF